MKQEIQQHQSSAIGSVLESREAQQVQVAMLAAKRFPRDEKACLDRILNSCCREGLAAQSQYSFAKGGTDIVGPSIRLAECLAQQWGNMEFGWREVDRRKDAAGVGESVIEAYAWDMETNTRKPMVFTVRHFRDTKKGGYALNDEREIYELCANQAARRLRACILAVIPGDIQEEAIKQCDATLAAHADAGPDAQKKMIEAFGKFGVTKTQIEARIQRRIDAITPAQIINLRKIHASLSDGMSVASDWFEEEKKPTEPINPFPAKDHKPKAKEQPTTADMTPEEQAAAWGDGDELPM